MRCILINFLALISIAVNAQTDSLNYKSKWQVKVGAGTHLSFPKLRGINTFSDELIGYSGSAAYIQPMSVSYFWKKRWGMEFAFQFLQKNDLAARAERFERFVGQRYDNEYFVDAYSGDELYGGTPPVTQGWLALVYRYEKGKFLVYPKVLVGLISYEPGLGNAWLKKINANNIASLGISPENPLLERGMFGASSTFGYKLSKRFFLNAELMLSHFNNNVVYNYTFKDISTGIENKEIISYKKNIYIMNVGIGLTYVFKYKDK
ncbi:MAG: hypothetical protein EOP00_19005 [Pedobacter sp.]|nr:MAG: hypothetical protein EOP00_19005 [Pedobacter sp.]